MAEIKLEKDFSLETMSGVDHPSTPKNRQFADYETSDGVASDRNSDDMCSITGEVFSPQFLRNHGIPQIMSFTPDVGDHDLARTGHQFNNSNIGLRRNDSGSSDFENKGYNDNNTNRQCLENERIGQNNSKFSGARYSKRAPSGLIVPPHYVASSPQLNQPAAAPESPMNRKMKFLCSFGGRILPRPCDGKLRYVGGETRIVSLKKDLTFEELMSKTSMICNQPYTIKYQLPGEDLDALISVCSNEDLNLMIEEYQELERIGGQRLRIFLVLLNEPEGPCFLDAKTAQQTEADHHYVYAVNGMLDQTTPRKGSGGHDGHPPVYNLMPNNWFNQSPPVSPSTIYRREYENSNYDRAFHEEGINRVIHRPPCDNSYYVDHKNYHDSPQNKPMSMIGYRQRNQYFADSNQAINRRGIHFHNRSPSSDVLPFPLYGQRDLNSERPFLMERALSDSQLQEREIINYQNLGEAIVTPSLRNDNDRENSSAQQSMLCPTHALPQQQIEITDVSLLSQDYQFNTTTPEICIKSQFTSNNLDCHVIETMPDDRDALMQSSKPAISSSEDTGKKSQNVSNKERSREKQKSEEGQSVQSQPFDFNDNKKLESMENSRTSSCKSGVVTNAQDEPKIELASTTGRASDRVVSEPDLEGNSGGRKNRNESFTDAAMPETEASIYSLQVVKDDDLEEVQELGSGTYGTVYYGKWRGTDVAIKRIKRSCFSGRVSEQERLIRDFWREAQILSTLHNPNVVAFYGVVRDGPGETMATVTEYMMSGSLRLALEKRDRALDRRKKLMITLDAAFGMEYLHLKNIVHFDLKCENLLVNLRDPHRPICKVADFGLSRIKQNTLVTGGVRGTLPWMAPELLSGNNDRVTEKVDVFSFGVAMWEILTGEEPYANLHCGAIIGGIISNTLRPPIPERCDAEWKRLIEECWSVDPGERPSFTEITNRLRAMSIALLPKRRNYANK